MLPSKTIPSTGRGSGKCPHRLHQQPTLEEVEDDETPQRLSQTLSFDSLFILEEIGSTGSAKRNKPKDLQRNPIYHFYEMVELGSNGKAGNSGDRHYKCYHGNWKVLTITKAMKSSLNGDFYSLLKERPVDDPITQEEISIASGKKKLNPGTATNYIKNLEAKLESIRRAFEKQEAQALGDWDQARFEELLLKWVVACDQPFDKVEKPEFKKLMEYTRHCAQPLKMPGQNGIKRRVMDMGEGGINETKIMFAVALTGTQEQN
ncbi:hypothetical protein BYT27DRAFT_7221221 [Phlegmacium glaucopus]|nr:hypothetical protein BYT27DRAFT_7221221 [Phlegmacium glaucopus]